MLQQTRVETVAAYYERFLHRFPTVAALAKANFQHVLKYWEGLGYYRRILHLHRAAREIEARGGVIPDTIEGLRELPGIGEYTAGAIASIAFDRPVPAVDGNAVRVLSRLFHTPPDAGNRRTIQRLAQALIPIDRPGDFNQAWMDLGSAICTPRAPQCPHCPLEKVCEAARCGLATNFPVPTSPRTARRVIIAVGVFRRDDRWLVRRRATGGLWSGLWEFPGVEIDPGRQPLATVRRLSKQLGFALDGRPRRCATVRHQLTHRSIRFEVYQCDVAGGIDPPLSPLIKGGGSLRWVDRRGFEKLPVSTAHRRIFAAALLECSVTPCG